MFGIGQCVICGNKGVCTVENITTLDISGVDKAKKYYKKAAELGSEKAKKLLENSRFDKQ